MEKLEDFVMTFFRKLNCEIEEENGGFIIKKIPKAYLDLARKVEPLKIIFSDVKEGFEFINKSSSLVIAIEKFLENAGKTTLLKLDFDIDVEKELSKFVNLKNCEIGNVTKKYKNHFFSRFSFLSIFSFLNEREQMMNEIYVHNGKVVDGDLEGYNVIEGNSNEADTENVKKDYLIAKEKLKQLLNPKTEILSEELSQRLEEENQRIKNYYDKQLSEFSGDLNKQLQRIKELELEMRVSEGEEKQELLKRIERMHKNLIKIADDEAKEKVLREREFSLRDCQQKFSLNLNNKLLNTTLIYYPLFSFNLLLKNGESKRILELTYDPLIKEFEDLNCESCGVKIKEILLCGSGHIVCENCILRCGECNKDFCKKCLTKSCSICGKNLCKSCLRVCKNCGGYICSNHLRKDSVSGEELCQRCLRACSRCHGVTQEKYFGESIDGSKVCQRCLGEEKRSKILKRIFEE